MITEYNDPICPNHADSYYQASVVPAAPVSFVSYSQWDEGGLGWPRAAADCSGTCPHRSDFDPRALPTGHTDGACCFSALWLRPRSSCFSQPRRQRLLAPVQLLGVAGHLPLRSLACRRSAPISACRFSWRCPVCVGVHVPPFDEDADIGSGHPVQQGLL